MAPIHKYQISVGDAELEKLRQKLKLIELPGELQDAAWDYGAPLVDVKRLANHWSNAFDWRAQESKLNRLPHFTTDVEINGFATINMHFVHQTTKSKDAIPLLFVHGWPGSFIEVTKILPLLQGGDGKQAFHVVAPSLPNFGFSSRVDKPGFLLKHYAEACHKVMVALGYDNYVTQGGDWGHVITHLIAMQFPDFCKANHTNMPLSRKPRDIEQSSLDLRDQKMLSRLDWFRQEGMGYFHEQSTKPQTLGYGLRDSPVALLAWIYEKLHDWTDNYPWTDDEVITWVSIYYHSRPGPDASTFIYREASHDPESSSLEKPVQCPIALAYFPKEINATPRKLIGDSLGPVKQASYFDKGGHFAAYERPEDLAGDICKFYGKEGPISDIIIKMRGGY